MNSWPGEACLRRKATQAAGPLRVEPGFAVRKHLPEHIQVNCNNLYVILAAFGDGHRANGAGLPAYVFNTYARTRIRVLGNYKLVDVSEDALCCCYCASRA